jgi:lipopolysaccharide/colanic/teichoic acid biosynthesis glycosyltransferase
MIKKIFDLLIAIFALSALSPILILVSIILKFTGEGEVFYKQTRVGKDGKNFGLLKFATMVKNSPKIGAGEVTLPNDSRVLPVGKFLRKTKINELPQILNILKGDISVVGPRPMVPNTFEKYPTKNREIIMKVKPGLTGIGSIIFRDEESYLKNKNNPLNFYDEKIIPYKSDLEAWYVKNASIKNYVLIILITAWIIIFPSSKIVDLAFKDLPKKPDFLR